jgi:hypothetical protein
VSLARGEGKSIILEVGKLHAGQKARLLDIQEAKLTPQRRHLIRFVQAAFIQSISRKAPLYLRNVAA